MHSRAWKTLTVLAWAIHGLAHACAASEWFDFNPPRDSFDQSAIDLRFLNEKFAGEHGVIAARGAQFVHSGNGEPVRFWGVNGPPNNLSGEALKQGARRLAKYG